MKPAKLAAAFGLAGALSFSIPANAATALFTGFGLPSADPALAGATVIDFSAVAPGTYTSLSVGGVTFGGGNGNFVITDNLGNSFNTQGRNFQNLQNQGSASVLNFTFSNPVMAFGFNFGASNEDWALETFDSSNNLLTNDLLNQTWFSNSGDYFGVAIANIASARLTQLTNVNDSGVDWILMDNFSYSSQTNNIPEPESLLLAGLGLAALANNRRRQKKI